MKKFKKIIDNTQNFIHSGWSNAVSVFSDGNPMGVDLFVCLEQELNYSYNKFNISEELIKSEKFIAFFHDPITIGDYYGENRTMPFDPKILELFQKKCIGIFFLSITQCKDFKKMFKENKIDIICETLTHPIQNIKYQFNPKKFIESSSKKITQSGFQLRKLSSIFTTQVPPNYEKHIVPWNETVFTRLKKELVNKKIIRKGYNKSVKNFISNSNVKLINELSNDDYLSLYEDNIMFVDLNDVTACNLVLDCISTNCPIILNRLPASVEYLGKNYPLFFEKSEDVFDLIADDSLIISAHEYLKNLCKEKFTIDSFKKSFVDSEIYSSIKSNDLRS